ncbi:MULTISPECIES: GGDEF domain-containing protein [Rhodomicrobium]|uniref:putative bifunctional diguanylate cyclase/phosphodiesterase n=1 Tax=Rhodomicrobium TaxID=1068 RepID=UPI00148382B4|nr:MULTISPECIES: GGDEF domain-containing protein [Rhodomicrobium]
MDEGAHSEALREICAIASAVMETPISLVSMLHEKDQRFAAQIGLELGESSGGMAFFNQTMLTPEATLVEDAAADARFASNPLVTEPPHVRAYAGVPLEAEPGTPVGALCAIDFEPHAFTDAQIALLTKLGAVASSVLHMHRMRLELKEEMAARHLREQDLWDAAHCDNLTGLANLKQFREFATAILDRQSQTRGCALILLDLDHFKSVNDRWGHAEGDVYLRRVAGQLTLSVRKQDLVARIGGDEFAILLTDIDGQEAPRRFAERILNNLHGIAEITGNPDLGRASLGIALAPLHASTLDDLYRCADAALYAAKTTGRNVCRLYIPRLDRRSANPANISREYRRALEAREFVPYYQPKFDLKTMTLVGFEALARWDTNDAGVLAPADFHGLFDDKELAPLLTRSMLMQMTAHRQAWQHTGLDCGVLGINASAADFLNEDFAREFLGVIADHQLRPQDFILEVTEQIILEDKDTRLFDMLKFLKKAGVLIVLDDFGTGYAGLKHLKNWPVDRIKIDRMFVRDCLEDARDRAIVDGIIKMAGALGLGVTAEGIETAEQLALLQSMNCEMGQGYLFARPMPAAEVPDYVREFRVWH